MQNIAEYRDQVTVFLQEWKTLCYSDDVTQFERVMAFTNPQLVPALELRP
jgi:hypothetical protein